MSNSLDIFYDEDSIDYSEMFQIIKSEYSTHQFIVIAFNNTTICIDVYQDPIMHNWCAFNYKIFPKRFSRDMYMYVINQVSLLTNKSINTIKELIVYE